MLFKRCCKCLIDKPLDKFGKNKNYPDGLQYRCRDCYNAYSAKYYSTIDKESNKKYRLKYLAENKDKVALSNKRYRQVNRAAISARRAKKLRNNPLFRLSCNLRSNIGAAFKVANNKKTSNTVDILGCTILEFKLYIESLWEPWMNWDNYGNSKGVATAKNHSWDLDHKVPLITAKTKEELEKLNHYTNFQPLCSYTNRNLKRGKYDKDK